MICVTVARGRHRMVQSEHEYLAENNVPLAELRVDYVTRDVDLSRLLTDRPTPVIITCRRPQDGGRWRYTEEKRLMLLRTAISMQADYVDLEWDIASKIPRFGKTKRIVSYHNFQETPSNLSRIWEKMKALDPDIIKIATMANSPNDNWVNLKISRDADVPTVAFCMGDIGAPSRILAGKFGSPFTYASISEERKLAPGQLSFKKLRSIYSYDDIKPSTKVLGVIADPVAHSMSPVVHNACIRRDGLDMVYLPFRVPAEHLEDFVFECPDFDVSGLSVTIPHKERILRALNDIDNNVSAIRACNTVLFRDKLRRGLNTDLAAIMYSVKKTLGIDQSTEKALLDKRVLVLGGGGVSKTVAWAMADAGARVLVSARNREQSEMIAADLKLETVDWEKRGETEFDILVNGTPVGMFPNMNESPFPEESLKEDHLVFDTVYNPEATLLVKKAGAVGCKVITGVEMFVRQAALQYKLFTGQDANRKLMGLELRRAISPAKF